MTEKRPNDLWDSNNPDPALLQRELAAFGGQTTLFHSDQQLSQAKRFEPLRQAIRQKGWLDPSQMAELLEYHSYTTSGFALAAFLTESNLVTEEHLLKARTLRRENTQKSLTEHLIDMKLLGEVTIAIKTALQYQLPFIALEHFALDRTGIRRIPQSFVKRWGALRLRNYNFGGIYAVIDPKPIDLEQMARDAQEPVVLAIAPQSLILRELAYWYDRNTEGSEQSSTRELWINPGADQAENNTTDATVVALVNRILLRAIEQRATDIHLTPGSRTLHVYYRIDGRLTPQSDLLLALRKPLISRIKVIAGMDISEHRLPQDGQVRIHLGNRSIDIRISCIPSIRGESLVLRLLDNRRGLVRLTDLGFFEKDRQHLAQAVLKPHGLILVTGPTGSGKSTTLAAALNALRQTGLQNIITVEDPVEIKMAGITQVQVHSKIGYTFAKALRHFLRHDPDVIMVGEIRDSETARIAVQASLTGHMVLSTLHTNDAFGSLTRLTDMGVEPYLVSSAVSLVLAQRLVRRLCPHCKKARPLSEDEQTTLKGMGISTATELYDPQGCDRCGTDGYQGQTVIYEILSMSDTLRELVALNVPTGKLRHEGEKMGFTSLIQTGAHKVAQGETTLSEVARFLDTLA
ncbi:GspE/PulE family protein [Magnetococcales bacterium HHB-1]